LKTNSNDPLKQLKTVKSKKFKLISKTEICLRVKYVVCLNIVFKKVVLNEIKNETAYFWSFAERLASVYAFNRSYSRVIDKILTSVENFCRNGSGWVIDHIEAVDLHIGKYNCLKGGCSSKHIKLPTPVF
jgi:hypothetical protein